MAEQIFLSDSRTAVDRKYVGFTPNGGSIKPVHVAGGAFRSIYGKYNATMSIKRLALVSDAKGVVPKGNELDTIYDLMKEGEKIEESVTPNALESLRNVMQRLLSADKGVYVVKGLKDDMISYTAGSSYFITRRSMYEDTGEFIGGLIKEYCPDLADYIKDVLSSANDPISLLFEPVVEKDMEEFQDVSRHEELPAFQNINENTAWFLQGIKESGLCLLELLAGAVGHFVGSGAADLLIGNGHFLLAGLQLESLHLPRLLYRSHRWGWGWFIVLVLQLFLCLLQLILCFFQRVLKCVYLLVQLFQFLVRLIQRVLCCIQLLICSI